MDKLITISALAAGLMLSHCATAQTETATGANAAPGSRASESKSTTVQLEELFVTAQKRVESAQRVPIAISALDGEALDNRGFDSLTSLNKLAPSIQLSNFGPIAFVSVRGIGNENTTAGGDPSVALHFDGVYIGRPIGTLFSSFDTERVEVLRGPQGTLYGRNATGGSINYISKKPTQTFGVVGDLTLGNYSMWRIRSAVNIPAGDIFSLRLVGYKEERDGFTQNSVSEGTDANDADNHGFRAHLMAKPSETLSVLLSSSYVHSGGVGSQAELRNPFPGATTGQNIGGPPVPGLNNYLVNGVPLVNDLRPFHEAKDVKESQDNTLKLTSLTVDYDMGMAAIKSITAYGEFSFLNRQDADYSSKNLGALNLVEGSRQFSQELQVLSNTGESSPLTWIAGAYYFKEDANRFSFYTGGRYDVFATAAGVQNGFRAGGTISTESYAFFGQGTYRVADRLRLTGGVRYTSDRKNGLNSGFIFNQGYQAPVGGDWSKVSYRGAADYQINDDVLTYLSYATGYKSGGVNQNTNPLVSNAVLQPENVDAAELGIKSKFFDRRVQLNFTVYSNRYKDLQFQVLGPTGASAYNAQGVTVQGIELETQAAITSGIRLDGSAALTRSEFDQQVIEEVDLSTSRVQRTPKFSANVGGSWDYSLGRVLDGRIRVDYSYTGSIFYSAFNRKNDFPNPLGSDWAPAYENVDARMFFYSKDHHWTGELFVTNVFDKVQVGNVFRSIGFVDVASPSAKGFEAVSYKPPRQYGMRIAVEF